MGDALAKRIAEAVHGVALEMQTSGKEVVVPVARIAADVAREYFEGKAVVDGKVFRVQPMEEYVSIQVGSPVYRLIPTEDPNYCDPDDELTEDDLQRRIDATEEGET